MITHSQARGMAESHWGTGGTNSSRTNRKGAFYFSCSGHGGFIIDGRALTAEERTALCEFSTPEKTQEIYSSTTGKVYGVFNPFATRRRSIRCGSDAMRLDIEIFAFEEDCDWCLPVIFAGIHVLEHGGQEQAMETFKRWKNPTNHQLIAAMASFRKHYPEFADKADIACAEGESA